MSVHHTNTSRRHKNTEYTKLLTNQSRNVDKQYEFFELDTALVTYVVDSIDSPEVQSGQIDKLGAIRCKPKGTHANTSDQDDIWAYPLDPNVKTYPVINELVVVGNFGIPSKTFYWSINYFNSPNYNGNQEFNTRDFIGIGPSNLNSSDFTPNLQRGVLEPFVGDTIFQSRFGSSIRMTDTSRSDDNISSYSPALLISNRIRGSKRSGNITLQTEDVNLDGSSIYLTSGPRNVAFQPNVYYNNAKKILLTGNAFERKTTFRTNEIIDNLPSSNNQEFENTEFTYPKELDGNQILLSSDRIILSSKLSETLLFSKGQLAMFSDSKVSIDSKLGFDLSTPNSSARIRSDNVFLNSPNIYLGVEQDRTQPAVLGDNMIIFLDSFFKDFSVFLKVIETMFSSAESQVLIPGLSVFLTKFSDHINQYYRITEDRKTTLLSNKVFIGSNERWSV